MYVYCSISYAVILVSCSLWIITAFLSQVDITLPSNRANIAVEANGQVFGSGSSFSVTLNRYQVYQAQSSGDLTGTRISSTARTAVFSGNVRTRVELSSSRDHLVEQMLPTCKPTTTTTTTTTWETRGRIFPCFLMLFYKYYLIKTGAQKVNKGFIIDVYFIPPVFCRSQYYLMSLSTNTMQCLVALMLI